MKRKSIFIISVFALLCVFCFITTSCSSGFEDESGEVTFSFSGSMLNNIMARGAGAYGLPAGVDEFLQNGIGLQNMMNIVYTGVGYVSGNTEPYVLYVFDDSTYGVYASSKLQSFSNIIQNINPLDSTSQGLINNFLSNFDSAAVSKGRWESEGISKIIITETQYFDKKTQKLVEVTNLDSFIIDLNSYSFIFSSNSGDEYTFNKMSSSGDFPYNAYPDADYDVGPKLRVELRAGGRTFVQEVGIEKIAYSDIVDDTELEQEDLINDVGYKPVTVNFTNQRLGAKAKVSAEIFMKEPYSGRYVIASGESNNFTISQTTKVSVILKFKDSDYIDNTDNFNYH